LADATFSLSFIGCLHRVAPAAPAAGSSSNVAGSCVADQSGREDRLDNDPVAAMTLHLHSIAAAELWYYSIVHKLTHLSAVGSSCGKKNKINY